MTAAGGPRAVTEAHERRAYEAGTDVIELGTRLEQLDERRASRHAIAAGMALCDAFDSDSAGTRAAVIGWATVRMAVDALDRARLEARCERAVAAIDREQAALENTCDMLDGRP
jgi:hypothetical protein